MNAMQQLAAQENERARRQWDRRRRKVGKEVEKIFFKVNVPLPVKRHRMAVIIETVSAETGISSEEILGRGRCAHVALARQYAMWKCREQGYSFPLIGRVFGRDHSTVMHGCRVIDKHMEGAQ
jgi:chromosomal replication initiation ATPase DnaA